MTNKDELKEKAIEYGIEIAKNLALSFITSKFSKKNKSPKENTVNSGSPESGLQYSGVNFNSESEQVKPIQIINEKKMKKKINKSGLIKKAIIGYALKEIVFDRLKAKLSHKPDVKDYSWLFDYPTGKNIIDMPQLINEINSEDNIIDLGCGLGYFAIASAQKANKGKTYCVDQDLNVLKRTQVSAEELGLANIEIHRAYIEQLPFSENTFDKAYLHITVGQLADKAKAFLEIKRVLKDGGQLIVTDIMLDDYYCLASTITQTANACGFKAISEKGNLLGYTLIFSK